MNIKILHITDLHFRHNGRLFYSTGKKINNGLLLNGHNVLNISDRDLTSQKKNIFDIGSKKYLFNTIIENIENFKPEMILFGHVDRLSYLNFLELKNRYKKIKFAQWFLDPLIKDGPDYEKNKSRFFLLEWTAPTEHIHGNWPGEIPEVHRWSYDYSKTYEDGSYIIEGQDFVPQHIPLQKNEEELNH